jgi:hypothetical protein
VLCRQCFQRKMRPAPTSVADAGMMAHAFSSPGSESSLGEVSAEPGGVGLPPHAAVLAAASISAASPRSSVATAEEMATAASWKTAGPSPSGMLSSAAVAVQMIARAPVEAVAEPVEATQV